MSDPIGEAKRLVEKIDWNHVLDQRSWVDQVTELVAAALAARDEELVKRDDEIAALVLKVEGRDEECALLTMKFDTSMSQHVAKNEEIAKLKAEKNESGLAYMHLAEAQKERELVLGPGSGELSQQELDRHTRAILAMSAEPELFHTTNCAVHSPTLRPCNCGLETGLRNEIIGLRAERDRYEKFCGICGEQPHAKNCRIGELERQRAAAEVKGMQRARKHVCRDCESEWPLEFRNDEWFHLVRGVYHWCRAQAIDAEIAKMSKTQPDKTTELKAALDAVSFPDRRWK